MTFQERSLRWEERGPRPAWWLLYLIGVLVVAVVGLIEIFVDGAWLRETLEIMGVIGGFVLAVVWRRSNRIALDLDRRHL